MKKEFNSLLGGALSSLKEEHRSIVDLIVVRDEFKNFIPPLSDEELVQLEENILAHGVRDPLVLWAQDSFYVLIDGHNRFAICQKYQLEFPFKKVEFKTEDEARDWMVKNQLGRRNLSPEQQSYLRGLRYNQEKAQGKRTDLASGQNDPKLKSNSTAENLASEYKVSPKTIKRDGEFARGIEIIGSKNPELKKKVLKGEAKISKGKIQALGKEGTLLDPPQAVDSGHKIKKLSALEVAQVAFDYMDKEIRPPKLFYQELGKDTDQIDPLEFFETWHRLKE